MNPKEELLYYRVCDLLERRRNKAAEFDDEWELFGAWRGFGFSTNLDFIDDTELESLINLLGKDALSLRLVFRLAFRFVHFMRNSDNAFIQIKTCSVDEMRTMLNNSAATQILERAIRKQLADEDIPPYSLSSTDVQPYYLDDCCISDTTKIELLAEPDSNYFCIIGDAINLKNVITLYVLKLDN